jgi:hypothetical protein
MDPEILALKQQVEELRKEVYLNNFSAQQDFFKRCHFNGRLRVPIVDALPTVCEIGELVSYLGDLYVSTAVNNWSIVGTQGPSVDALLLES